jgi:hypothetical protein
VIDPAVIEQHVKRTRAASGVPPKVEDRAALRTIADIFRAVRDRNNEDEESDP